MKVVGEKVIHDKELQFYLFLKIKLEIERLVTEIELINKPIKILTEWKKTKDFYTSKTTYYCSFFIDGTKYGQELTLDKWKKVLTSKKKEYDTLISYFQDAIEFSLKSSYPKLYEADPQRENTLVEKGELN